MTPTYVCTTPKVCTMCIIVLCYYTPLPILGTSNHNNNNNNQHVTEAKKLEFLACGISTYVLSAASNWIQNGKRGSQRKRENKVGDQLWGFGRQKTHGHSWASGIASCT